MRLFKFTLVTCLVFVITFSAVFYSRSSVVTSLVNDYLSQYNSALSCIDFEVNNDFDLLITRLCIDSPDVEIELINSLIEWRFDPNKIDVDNLLDAISSINVELARVRAKSDFQFSGSSASNNIKPSELPLFIRKQLHDLSLLSMPINIDIQTVYYQTFSSNKKTENQTYRGHLLLHDQQLAFSLVNPKHDSVLALALTKSGEDISASLATDLALLRPFLVRHQMVFPHSISALLLNDDWSAEGKLNSQLDWQQNTLHLTNQMTNFSLELSQGSSPFGPIELETTLSWQAVLVGETLQFDFTHVDKKKNAKTKNGKNYQDNNIQLAFNSEKLLALLTAQAVDQQIINVLRDNAINTLNVKPSAKLTIDFSQQTLTGDSVDISSRNLHGPIKLSLSNVGFTFNDEPVLTMNLQKAKLLLTGQASIAQLHPYGRQPVKLSIIGGVKQSSDSWQLTLAEGTAFELAQLSLPSNQSAMIALGKTQQPTFETQASLKSLSSHWQGNVSIAKNENLQQLKQNVAVMFSLDVKSQIKQLNYPTIVKINKLELATKLSGTMEELAVKTEVIADDIPIATANITGALEHPSVIVSAQDVLLTDLLALKLNLPVELKLIDGNIDYHLSGQFNNNENLLANPMILELIVQDVTGEVDGTWLQEFNWQHKLTIQDGKIKSMPNQTQLSPDLTIAKIETATPIKNFSTSTFIDFSAGSLQLFAHNLHGHLLGGRFAIPQVQWPFRTNLPVKVALTKIDLEKLLELDKKQGIVVTGRVSGLFPIHYDGENFLINGGSLKNVGDGIIQVYNNPAVEELKASSTELKLAFDALENLHYHHLSSDVSMANDGYMLLDTAIKGRNPDLDNDVNLNLNLSYDLLGLIESLNITEDFESKIIKGLRTK
ncbi:YdbH domain-containing protein [Colwellia psychrerythraea]|uniref:Dicarboxylate transport n=1 Tax=Colwellia psychrerythraea TaxID=28229 RepID=A0A099KUL1_COLPS|nr:YdbH domain-containing protein [Colwellia psychrerythraea]KGJ94454.1 Dicarboxylate transport [Colwellia psychrerythraea]